MDKYKKLWKALPNHAKYDEILWTKYDLAASDLKIKTDWRGIQ